MAVECLFTWYWLADVCAQEGVPFVLGHALYRKAIHGGQAKTDRIDAHKIAVLLRGGMPPQASVSPRAMRATRDLLGRRTHLVRKRGQLLAHIQNTNSQYTLPEFGKKIAYQGHRGDLPARFAVVEDPQCAQDDRSGPRAHRPLRPPDPRPPAPPPALGQGARSSKRLPAQARARDRGDPRLGILYELHDIHRFPDVGDFVSYRRLVKCAKESAGKRLGASGAKIGHAHLTWAFSEAAVLFLRQNPRGRKFFQKLERRYGKGKALTILAHKLARAVSFMLTRRQAFDLNRFLQS